MKENKTIATGAVLDQILDDCPVDSKGAIGNSFIVASSKLKAYDRVLCTVSGGSDSDIVIDLVSKLDVENKVQYLFVMPGIEYKATLRHIEYLENRYGVEIQVERPQKSVPACCREYGQPFVSKLASSMISRLQKHGFQWEDEPLEVLREKYFNCEGALRWWCNDYGEKSRFNIDWNVGLKKFLVKYPPYFLISGKCCEKTKKAVIHKYIQKNDIQLNLYGVRKAEGGIRASSYKTCFSDKNGEGADEYRPIFKYGNDTKRIYEDHYCITHSDCYYVYGLLRTGCVGCPCGRNLEAELEAARLYEPGLYRAVCNIFKDSYTYTRMYREYVATGAVSEVLLKEFKVNKAAYSLKE